MHPQHYCANLLNQVAQYLRAKRDMMFLEWSLTVKHYVRETCLGIGDEHAYDIVSTNIHTGLPPLGSSFFVSAIFEMKVSSAVLHG